MRNIISLSVAVLLLAVSTQGLADKDDPNLDLIKARQGEMQLRAYFLGPLVAMARGKMDYDARMAAALARDMQSLNELDTGRAWAVHTGNDTYPGETAALPKIWTSQPEFAKYGKEYQTALDALAGSAGNGLAALRANLGAVGDACKGCHDNFVEKK